MSTKCSTDSEYVRDFLKNMPQNPQRLEELKQELRKQVTKSKLKLIKGGRD